MEQSIQINKKICSILCQDKCYGEKHTKHRKTNHEKVMKVLCKDVILKLVARKSSPEV